jgi:hypothetical protein
MPLFIHIPELEERIKVQRDFANCSKWWNRKNDSGRQAQTAARHRIPSVNRA